MAPERALGLIPEGAAAWRGGVEGVQQPRTLYTEGWNDPINALRALPLAGYFTDESTSARDYIASKVRPEMKAAYEWGAERDALTGETMRAPDFTSMVPPNTPGVPWQLEAGIDENMKPQMPWATRHLPQYFFNPMTQQLMNRGLFALGGGWDTKDPRPVSPQVLGQSRVFADPNSHPAAQFGGQGVNMMGFPNFEVNPNASLLKRYRPEVGDFLGEEKGGKKLAKKVRRAGR